MCGQLAIEGDLMIIILSVTAAKAPGGDLRPRGETPAEDSAEGRAATAANAVAATTTAESEPAAAAANDAATSTSTESEP